jgi:hypothetical protein
MIAVMDPTSFFREAKRHNVGRFVALTLALAAVAQAQAEQRTDKIVMSGNPGRDANRADRAWRGGAR